MRWIPLTTGLLALAALTAACDQQNPEEEPVSAPAPPPAAMITPMSEGASLQERLERLDAELHAIMEGGFGDDLHARLLRAEAITDRLLEAEPPVYWLASQYSTEARLRQLQALADRIVAKSRRDDMALRDLADDVALLQKEVAGLRAELARGSGGPMPLPLDTLLARRPSQPVPGGGAGGKPDTAEQTEPAPAGPQLLGVPVDSIGL